MNVRAKIQRETLLAFERVGKTFSNGHVAISGLDLEVRRGEFLTLLGPSGCGKSTVLRLVAGLATPTSGAIRWTESRLREKIGFVFQEPTLLPWANVFDNVFLPLRLAGASRAGAAPAVFGALERVGLRRFNAALPRELSGGMKMRCAIARALVASPPLLLMDEPFAALDEPTRLALDDELLALQAALGWTVAFVTHSVYEAVALSDRILVFSAHGAIVEEIVVETQERGAAFRSSPAFAAHVRRAFQAMERTAEGKIG